MIKSGVLFNKLLLLLAGCVFLLGADLMVLVPIMPVLEHDFGASKEQLGYLASIYTLSFAVMALLTGPISDRLGRRQMLLFGVTLFALANGLCSISDSYVTLLVFRGLAGSGAGVAFPNIWASVSVLVSGDKIGRAMALVLGAMSLSSIIGMPISSLITSFVGWHGLFLVFACTAIPFALLLFVIGDFKRLNSIPTKSGYFQKFYKVLQNDRARFALWSTFFWNFSLFSLFTFLGAFYSDNYRFDLRMIGLVLIAGGLANLLGTTLGGKAADSYNKQNIIRLAAGGAAISLLLFSLNISLTVSILAQLVWSFMVGFGAASLTSIVTSHEKDERATLMSLNSFASTSAMTIGGGIGGLVLSMAHSHYWVVGIVAFTAGMLVNRTIPAYRQ
jgi:DHA1 family inner membrane transport protein